MNDKPTFHTHSEMGNLATEIALHLWATGHPASLGGVGGSDPVGTATVIAPNVAITAKHVIKSYAKKFGLREPGTGDLIIPASLEAIMCMADGSSAYSFPVGRISTMGSADIAILRLDSCPPKWAVPRLRLFAPAVGTRISAGGYHGPDDLLSSTDESDEALRDFSQTTGTVQEVHPEQRESAYLNFPCFQTNMRIDNKMSGGPVFDDRGRLCGILCSELVMGEYADDHVSYVSSLLPLVGHVIDFGRPGHIGEVLGYHRTDWKPKPERMFDLMKDGIIDVVQEDMDAVTAMIESGQLSI